MLTLSSLVRPQGPLTHWGRVTHICISKLTIIGSGNSLSPGRRQAIIWTNAGILSIRTSGTNFSEIVIEIQTFSLKKMRLKMSSAKRQPFCLGLNVLTTSDYLMRIRHRFSNVVRDVSLLNNQSSCRGYETPWLMWCRCNASRNRFDVTCHHFLIGAILVLWTIFSLDYFSNNEDLLHKHHKKAQTFRLIYGDLCMVVSGQSSVHASMCNT